MDNIILLKRLGLFIIEEFLSPEQCQDMIKAVNSGKSSVSSVVTAGKSHIDREVRSTLITSVASDTLEQINSKLRSIQSTVASHYQRTPENIEGTQFLTYNPGGYYVAHTDNGDHTVANRAITAVIFLNHETKDERPDHYTGGGLTIYGLVKKPGAEKFGMTVHSSTGLLVTFPSDMFHGVSPVTWGKRHSIVSWYIQNGSPEALAGSPEK